MPSRLNAVGPTKKIGRTLIRKKLRISEIVRSGLPTSETFLVASFTTASQRYRRITTDGRPCSARTGTRWPDPTRTNGCSPRLTTWRKFGGYAVRGCAQRPQFPPKLRLIDPTRAEAFATSFLAGLNDEQLETLRCFLRHHGSQLKGADELGLHRNAVRNRLDVIDATLPGVFDDPQIRVSAWITLQSLPTCRVTAAPARVHASKAEMLSQ